jgi:hypothetical protein
MSLSWQSWFAQFWINISIKLTFIKGHIFETLRGLKREQDRESTDTFTKTRPPEGVEIEYPYFRLFDIFQIEDANKLLKGLRKLFPYFNDPFIEGHYNENFIRNATGMTVGEWLNIGCLYKENKGRRFYGRSSKINELPSFVDYINVELHKILPSIFVITYDVHLNDNLINKLIELQSTKYLPDIKLRNIIPYHKGSVGYSMLPAELVMERNIGEWFTNLRYSVEDCLKNYIKGEFLNDKSKLYNHLPSIEVFIFKGLPETRKAIINWINKSNRWLGSLGLHYLFINAFTNGKLFFIPKTLQTYDNGIPSYRIIISYEAYVKSLNKEIKGKIEKGAVIYKSQNILTSMQSPLVIFELLRRFEIKFKKIRQEVFQTINSSGIREYILIRDIMLSNSVLRASSLYDRISKDYHLESKNITRQLKEVSDMIEINNSIKGKVLHLDIELNKGINNRIRILKEHVEFAMNWLAQFLSLRNLFFTNMLALIAVIAAISSIIISLLYRTKP